MDRAISSGTAAARNRKNRRRQCKGRRDETVARRVLPTLSPPTSRCQRSSQPAARGRNSQNRTAHVIHKRNHSFFFIIRTNINLISSIIMIYVKWINFNFNFTVSVYTRIGTDIRRQRVVVVSSTSHSQTSRLLLCPRYEQSIAVSLFFFLRERTMMIGDWSTLLHVSFHSNCHGSRVYLVHTSRVLESWPAVCRTR